jgi:hypothetical protein
MEWKARRRYLSLDCSAASTRASHQPRSNSFPKAQKAWEGSKDSGVGVNVKHIGRRPW